MDFYVNSFSYMIYCSFYCFRGIIWFELMEVAKVQEGMDMCISQLDMGINDMVKNTCEGGDQEEKTKDV